MKSNHWHQYICKDDIKQIDDCNLKPFKEGDAVIFIGYRKMSIAILMGWRNIIISIPK